MFEVQGTRTPVNFENVRTWAGFKRYMLLPEKDYPCLRYQRVEVVVNWPQGQLLESFDGVAHFKSLFLAFEALSRETIERRFKSRKDWWDKMNAEGPIQEILSFWVYPPALILAKPLAGYLVLWEQSALYCMATSEISNVPLTRALYECKIREIKNAYEYIALKTGTQRLDSKEGFVIDSCLPFQQELETMEEVLVKIAVHPERTQIIQDCLEIF